MTPTTFRLLRETLGLSVAFVADSLGVSRRQATRWEHGQAPLPETAGTWMRQWVDLTEAHIAWAIEEGRDQLCVHSSAGRYHLGHGARSSQLSHTWWNRCAGRVAAVTGVELVEDLCLEPRVRPPAMASPACDTVE